MPRWLRDRLTDVRVEVGSRYLTWLAGRASKRFGVNKAAIVWQMAEDAALKTPLPLKEAVHRAALTVAYGRNKPRPHAE